ncbi:MAG: sporulation protein YqfD [Clostridia bacterium]|nr:sporulation protein YqfD [Clostridia bacterium]
MVSRVLRWFAGWVRVETEGGYPERLFNELTAAGIAVWHVRSGEERTRFSCFAGDYRSLRPPARRACVRMRLRQKHGLPFWRHRYRHRRGLLVGLVVYAAILLLLSSRIWVVEVTGNEKTSIDTILAVVAQYGVELGAPMDGMAIKSLQLYGPDRLPAVAFITVNPNGCVARVEVTERAETPQIIDLSVPSDLVALRDGLIRSVEVRSGKRLVQVGEAVTAGTTLITGRVETELGEKRYRAYGEVWAQTRRQITVTVPLTDTRWVPQNMVVCRPTVSFLCWNFPLYSDSPLQGETLHKQRVHRLTIGERELPLGVTNDYYFPLQTETYSRTETEAEVLAQEQLARQERELFVDADYERLQTEGMMTEEGFVLTAVYRCYENIALEVPLDSDS